MHILIALLGALGAAFWAFTYFSRAASEGRDAINDVRGAIRRGKWSRRIDRRLIENLSDPREAAAIVLYQIAAYDGAVTDRQRAAINDEMRSAFEADDETVEGLFAFARMAVGEINDAANSLNKILRPVADICTDEEKQSLVSMLIRIGEIEGDLTDAQRRLIAETEKRLAPER